MTAATAIPRLSLHDEVVARLRDLIIRGELLPNERLGERELCERFEISRTPLREALKVLAAEGLVELLPHRGARVASLTADDVQHMFEVMASLEALSGELAATRITDAQLAEIEELHVRMVEAYHRRDLPVYFDYNQAIHERIILAGGNPVLREVYQGLSGRIRRARYAANTSEERWAAAVREHEEMLTALHARDAAALAEILRDHLHKKCQVVLGHLAAGDPF
ncbi:MAG TPA: GntR family transcriptional regulator [Candidatus Acidoferrum sp.]|nr:GntR family transcriptional regulator [Candidatus Acidoferrum sp.]